MNRSIKWFDVVGVCCIAFALSYVFWSKLWTGGGFIGGDTYSYFMPQKQFLSESLKAGTLPFWHNRTGFGYPLVAESQTGVFYPPNWVLYRFFDFHTAYHASQLAHYIAATIGMWWLAREWGLRQFSAVFAATVFVYGWFPPRSCLEWAIIGGSYLPFALVFVEKFIKQRQPIMLPLLALLLGMQMTAGHFHLAFITQITAASYALLRLFWMQTAVPAVLNSDATLPSLRSKWKSLGWLGVSMLAAFAIASVQLIPSWELKLTSQRQTTHSREFDPGYGHIPPLYLSQLGASWWWWYSNEIDRDQALAELTFGAIKSGTNQVEAHLYLGVLPLLFIMYSLLRPQLRQLCFDRAGWIWLILAIAAVLYATGWLLPITRHLPGFSFFRGLGRFGIVTTLAGAMLAGRACDAISFNWNRTKQFVVLPLIFAATVYDLHYVATQVRYAVAINVAPIATLEHSDIRHELRKFNGQVRLDAPGANLTNLLGVSSVPEYLGLGPIEYYEIASQARGLDDSHPDAASLSLQERTEKYLNWAEQHGITHVLLFNPLPRSVSESRLRLVYLGLDTFLNRAWGRAPHERVCLYELPQSRGRVSAALDRDGTVKITTYEPNRIVLEADLNQDSTVILRDLIYPGWTVTVDGKPETAQRIDQLFRGVSVSAGKHRIEWHFRPSYFSASVLISLLAVAGSIVWALCLKRQKQRI